jgi:hypothetical protein
MRVLRLQEDELALLPQEAQNSIRRLTQSPAGAAH